MPSSGISSRHSEFSRVPVLWIFPGSGVRVRVSRCFRVRRADAPGLSGTFREFSPLVFSGFAGGLRLGDGGDSSGLCCCRAGAPRQILRRAHTQSPYFYYLCLHETHLSGNGHLAGRPCHRVPLQGLHLADRRDNRLRTSAMGRGMRRAYGHRRRPRFPLPDAPYGHPPPRRHPPHARTQRSYRRAGRRAGFQLCRLPAAGAQGRHLRRTPYPRRRAQGLRLCLRAG